jgi:putative nucleotidyltransferase with HDIG domain
MDLHFRARQRKEDTSDARARRATVREVLARSIESLLAPQLVKRLFWTAEVIAFAAAVGASVWVGHADEWQPLLLVALLVALTLVGHWLTVTVRTVQLSASMVALLLAMSLLGPAPAVALGIGLMILTSSLRRLSATQWLSNLSTFAVFLFIGGFLVRTLAGDVHQAANQVPRSVTFGLILFGVFIMIAVINFVLVALELRVTEGRSIVRQAREIFFPLLPGLLATGALATILAVAYTNLGMPVLIGSVVVLVIFQRLTIALMRSEDRADQLEARTIHLVSLQLGVLRTLVRALGTRDETTGRHSAAVARYARALAQEVGGSNDEQETVHTAGLLHDIGKFTWPDRVLHADVVDPQDQEIVRRHPQDGAELVGALDGYGAVADAILYHHERVDGGGYPAGLIGSEIPLSSRILAICCIYDTMTMRDSYRPPMTPEEARTELRAAAGHGQLDGELVESFIGLLERDEPLFAEGEDASFETELAFEQRVRNMAQATPR